MIHEWWGKLDEKQKEKLLSNPLFACLKGGHSFARNVFFQNGWIDSYLVFPILATLRTLKIPMFYNDYKTIETFKNKYEGDRCFIIATGPSLRVDDVNKLKNEHTFVVNSFYRIFEKTDFRPSFYVTLEPGADKGFLRNGAYEPQKYSRIASFMNAKDKGKYKGIVYLPVCYQNHYYRLLTPGFDYRKNLKYTEDLLWGIYDKYTVTTAVIDIALYMGFKEIYLLGVDCNFHGDKVHFVEEKSDVFWQNKSAAEMQETAMMCGYEFLDKETRKRGIRIYNATRGGSLEEFERIDFDSLQFKECDESC